MNVLVVSLALFKPKIGGLAEYTHRLAESLAAKGNKVVLLATAMEGDSTFDESSNYSIKRIGISSVPKKYQLGQLVSAGREIRRIIKKERIDVVLSNMQHWGYLAWLSSRFSGVPFCVFVYGKELSPSDPKIQRLNIAHTLKRADKVFCISEFTRQCVLELGTPTERTALTPPGLTDEFIAEAAREGDALVASLKERYGLESRPVIMTLSHLGRRKGIDKTIEAMAHVIQAVPDAVYLVAGEGPMEKELKESVDRLGLAKNVVFTGLVDEEEKAGFYRLCDIYVMSSRQAEGFDVEGFGIVFLEANAYQKPVIGGRSGGIIDAVEDGGSGFLVDPTSPEAIAEKIILILKDQALSRRLGKRGRERVVEEFRWQDIATKLETELSQLIQAQEN